MCWLIVVQFHLFRTRGAFLGVLELHGFFHWTKPIYAFLFRMVTCARNIICVLLASLFSLLLLMHFWSLSEAFWPFLVLLAATVEDEAQVAFAYTFSFAHFSNCPMIDRCTIAPLLGSQFKPIVHL